MPIDARDWPDLSRILDRMLEEPSWRRSEWVRRLSGADSVHVPQLLELLRAGDSPEFRNWFDTLPKFTAGGAPGAGDDDGAAAGDVGPYRLVRLLARGGMGSVWYAERTDGAMHRGVALKLPQGLLGDAVMAGRFARERDILASLAHPHIAPLYDAGIGFDGQPYLALEYVEGKPIDEYCDAHALTIGARIGLFRQVLEAVHYAHSRLVIHRDLKPSNILVTDAGHVRLLDFGIAKLLAGEASEGTELTHQGSSLMTLSYASPEQVAGQPVGTATDIYSLGVVFFELLVGMRPYRLQRPGRGALEEAVLSADIPLPSAVAGAAASRSAAARGRRRELRGDLDAILLKMLKRCPQDRYATVAAVSEDLARFAAGEPVLAHRPSRMYRARKFIARHRLMAASASLASAALVAGAAVALWQAREARHQAQAASAARDRAVAAAAHREAVDEFMTELLLEAGRTGQPVSIADLVARAATLSAQEFSDDAEARAAVLATVGHFALNIDGIDQALPYFDQAEELVSGSDDTALRADIVCTRAKIRGIAGKVEEAQHTFDAVLNDRSASAAARSICWGDAARLAVLRYDGAAARNAADRALAEWQASPRRSPALRLELLTYRAEAMVLEGKPDAAERTYAWVMEQLQRTGRARSALSEEVLADRINAALRTGDFKRALGLVDTALAMSREDFPDRPPSVVWLYDRSVVLAQLGRYADATKGFLDVARMAAARDRLSQQRAELDAATVMSKLGRTEEAERHFAAAVELARAGTPGQVPLADVATILARAKLDLDQGRAHIVRSSLAELLRRPAMAASSRAVAYRLKALAALADGAWDEALADARTAVGLSDQQRGDKPFSAWLGQAELVLGQVMQASGDPLAAQQAYSAAVTQLAPTVDADHPGLVQARGLLAALARTMADR